MIHVSLWRIQTESSTDYLGFMDSGTATSVAFGIASSQRRENLLIQFDLVRNCVYTGRYGQM